MNKFIYKLSRPLDVNKGIDYVIYLETLHDVYLCLKELSDDVCEVTHLEVIPLVHYS